MPRRHAQTVDAPGHDSFLDIVANMVGILIILVMVAGVRAKRQPTQVAQGEIVQATTVGLETDLAFELSLRRDIQDLAEQLRRFEAETLARDEVRRRTAAAVAMAERQVESSRSELDAESQADFRLRRELAQSQSEWDRLCHERQLVQQAEATPTVIESYPTPLSHRVEGRELHFQLQQGHVVHIPLERLLERFKQDAQRKAYKLLKLPELTDIVGPEGGFRLRYTLVRRELSPEAQRATGVQGSYAELDHWRLIPVASRLGEPVDMALAPGSSFHEILASHSPDTTTVTIWTYADSFAEFRALKKSLYALGYATAARPLPKDVPMGGSPNGTKSAAQ